MHLNNIFVEDLFHPRFIKTQRNHMSLTRRPAGPIRQHSLQQPPPRRHQNHHHHIRRQRSADDEKNNTKHLKILSTKADFVPKPDRPKLPSAWSDQTSTSSSSSLTSSRTRASDSNVEIVAKQIQASAKSSSSRSNSANKKSAHYRPPLAEKATILYSRQELAERLRLAWKQRQETKSNLDIFLAHNTLEEEDEGRCESRMSAASDASNVKAAESEEEANFGTEDRKPSGDRDSSGLNFKSWNKVEIGKKVAQNQETDNQQEENLILEQIKINDRILKIVGKKEERPATASNEDLKNEAETSSSMEKIESPKANSEKTVPTKKSFISIDCTTWSSCTTYDTDEISSHEPEIAELSPIPTPKPVTDSSRAKQKRANFQSGQNKAFLSPVVDKSPATNVITNGITRSSSLDSGLRRSSSAPVPRRPQVNVIVDTLGRTPILEPHSVQAPIFAPPIIHPLHHHHRAIKSAPIKRRSGKSVRKHRSFDKDDKGSKGKSSKTKLPGDSSHKSNDVVTMVSLVSSTDGESESEEDSARDPKLISELRSKLPTTPIIKTAGINALARKPVKSVSFQDSYDCPTPPKVEISPEVKSSLQTRLLALAKGSSILPNFPLCSPSSSSSSASVNTSTGDHQTSPWTKSEAAHQALTGNLPLLNLTNNAAGSDANNSDCGQSDAPLTDREKRCLAVPIGENVLDKKRKLVRSRSSAGVPSAKLGIDIGNNNKRAELTERNSAHHQSPIVQSVQITLQNSANLDNNNQQENIAPKIFRESRSLDASDKSFEMSKNDETMTPESDCQTPKEKECWHLYRRMCDKGVFVSFDTVLRGMLTPTEYRLRQKEMQQNC